MIQVLPGAPHSTLAAAHLIAAMPASEALPNVTEEPECAPSGRLPVPT